MNSRPSHSKLKILAVVVAALIIVALVLAAIIFARNNRKPSEIISAGKNNTATLQIYAALDNEIPIESLEGVVKEQGYGAKVDIYDGYGTIVLPGNENEIISFQLDNEATSEDDEEPFEDSWAGILGARQPNTAYDFVYSLQSRGTDGPDIYIAQESDTSGIIFRYFDGTDLYDFPTKEEAIASYLAPVLEDLE